MQFFKRSKSENRDAEIKRLESLRTAAPASPIDQRAANVKSGNLDANARYSFPTYRANW